MLRLTSWIILFVALFPLTVNVRAETIAATDSFTADANGVPTSATTTFYLPIWTNGDATNTTHHELLHAIGFSTQYEYFNTHVNDVRNFCDTPTDPCTVLAKLTPADQGTHIDPDAGTVNGFDQAVSVMRPDRVDGLRMDGQEQSVLNTAFMWSSRKIKISVNYVGDFDSTKKGYISDAVDSAHTLFGTSDSVAPFIWTVKLDGAAAAPARPMTEFSALSTKQLLDALKSSSSQRVAMVNEVLNRGLVAVPELRRAGAQPMRGINPALIDVLFTLTTGRIEGRIRTTSFGLHVVPGTTRDQVVEMGRRLGFTLRDTDRFDASSKPACYVVLTQPQELLTLMARVFRSEPLVTSVNFNYIEE